MSRARPARGLDLRPRHGPQLDWAVPDMGRARNCVLWAGLLGTAQMYTYIANGQVERRLGGLAWERGAPDSQPCSARLRCIGVACFAVVVGQSEMRCDTCNVQAMHASATGHCVAQPLEKTRKKAPTPAGEWSARSANPRLAGCRLGSLGRLTRCEKCMVCISYIYADRDSVEGLLLMDWFGPD
jgi:hypothetical protein